MLYAQRHYPLLCLLLIIVSTFALPTRVVQVSGLTPSRILTATRAKLLENNDLEAFERRDGSILQAGVPIPSQQVQNATALSGAENNTSLGPSAGFIPNGNETSPSVDCRNLATGHDNKCWNELRLTDWVNSWVASNSMNCTQGEAFASCFLRLNEFYMMDCTGIKLDSCGPPFSQYFKDNPELFYVTYNIHGKFSK